MDYAMGSLGIPEGDKNQELIELLAEYGGESTLELNLNQAIHFNRIEYFKREYGENGDRETGARLLQTAAISDAFEIAEYLLALGIPVHGSKQDSITLLHLSAATGGLKTTEVLIDYGADVNSQAEDGLTPLHSASKNAFALNEDSDHIGVAALLIRNGARINARDKHGKTLFDWAAERGFEKIAHLLQENGGVSGTALEEED